MVELFHYTDLYMCIRPPKVWQKLIVPSYHPVPSGKPFRLGRTTSTTPSPPASKHIINSLSEYLFLDSKPWLGNQKHSNIK